jgi:hypothetical protein
MATVEPEPARFDLAGFFAPASRRSSLHSKVPDCWAKSAVANIMISAPRENQVPRPASLSKIFVFERDVTFCSIPFTRGRTAQENQPSAPHSNLPVIKVHYHLLLCNSSN